MYYLTIPITKMPKNISAPDTCFQQLAFISDAQSDKFAQFEIDDKVATGESGSKFLSLSGSALNNAIHVTIKELYTMPG